MPHVHLDAVGGIAGDMFVAAMLDALPSIREKVLGDVKALLPKSAGVCLFEKRVNGALCGKGFRLMPNSAKNTSAHEHDHKHDSHHDHGHEPQYVPGHGHESAAFPSPGSFLDMVCRIRSANLSPNTAKHATSILTHIADVEATIHDVPLDRVHFHEIADWDSLMDVVAAGSIVAALNGTWSVSDLPRGGGLIGTQHGLLPVPAPATAALLTGFTWRDDGIGGERVTPTGAAILRYLVDEPGLQIRAEGRLSAVGIGVGTKTFPGIPNILRAMVFEPPEAGRKQTGGKESDSDIVAVIAFDIDDMTGEEIGVAADHLRTCDGVLDVAIGTMLGKKARPVSSFRLLVTPGNLAYVKDCCFTETSTIGLRWHLEERELLTRQSFRKTQSGVDVRIKQVVRPDNSHSVKVESDDLASTKGLMARRSVKAKMEHKA